SLHTAWGRGPSGGGGGGGRGPGGGGGGFRGGSPPAHSSAAPHAGPGPAAPARAPVGPAGHADFSHSVGIHGGAPGPHPGGGMPHSGPMPHGGAPLTHHGAFPAHGGPPGGHPGFGPGAVHDPHYAGMMHTAGPHWNGYHQAYIGHQPVRLAYAGYRPS